MRRNTATGAVSGFSRTTTDESCLYRSVICSSLTLLCTLRFRVTDRLEELIGECVGAYGKKKRKRKKIEKTEKKNISFFTKFADLRARDSFIIFNQLVYIRKYLVMNKFCDTGDVTTTKNMWIMINKFN